MSSADRPYHWTPALQRRFAEHLAATGSVRRACRAVGKSPKSAYALRRRTDAPGFAAWWDAAILVAAQVIGDAVFDHAVDPIAYTGSRHPRTGRIRWHRVEPLLGPGQGVALVTRLDRAALAITRDRARVDAARHIMCDLWRKCGDARDGDDSDDGRAGAQR